MYHMIVNPASRSGRGEKIWHTLLPVLKKNQTAYKVYLTKGTGDAGRIAKELTSDPSAPVKIIILGGDGTINEVLQGIQHFELTDIAYIPTGSSNDLARDMCLQTDPIQALEQILKSESIVMTDIGCLTCNNGYYSLSGDYVPGVHTRYFHVSTGIGFDAAVCEYALTSKIKDTLNHLGLGKLTYLGIALRLLLKGETASCQITFDGTDTMQLDHLLFAAVMNHRYEGGGFMFAPDADYADGLLNLCAAHKLTFLRALRILPTAFSGNHLHFPEIRSGKSSYIQIKTDRPLCIHTDGEVPFHADDITITISPCKLRLIPTNL